VPTGGLLDSGGLFQQGQSEVGVTVDNRVLHHLQHLRVKTTSLITVTCKMTWMLVMHIKPGLSYWIWIIIQTTYCSIKIVQPIIGRDDSGRYLHRPDWRVNTREWPDKPGSSRCHFGQAVLRSFTGILSNPTRTSAKLHMIAPVYAFLVIQKCYFPLTGSASNDVGY